MLTDTGRFEVFRAGEGFGWLLRDGTSEILALSTGYPTRRAATAQIERLRVVALTADICDLDD